MFFDLGSLFLGVFIGFALASGLLFFTLRAKNASFTALKNAYDESQEKLQQQSLDLVELNSRLMRMNEVETKLETTQKELNAALQDKQVLLTKLEHERKSLDEQKTLLTNAEAKLLDTFKALSGDVLEKNNKAFLDLAQQRFKNLQDQANSDLASKEKAISNLVNPVKESLDSVKVKLADLEKSRISAYEVLKHQVTDLIHTQKDLRLETANLVKALRAPSVRGRWGEMQLKRVVEITGLSSHCDFVEQVTVDSDKGVLRPDMVVNLPGGKQIVIDAKAPLSAYLEALEATDEKTRKERMRDHARQVKAHIISLSSKAYWDQFPANTTPEFVVLFLPGETFFSAALEHDPSLIELGVEKKVILTTPSTLIALLHAVAFGWRQEALAENAQEISTLGRDLYKRLSDMGGHVNKLGRDLNQAVKSYNSTVGTLERRVLPTARKFKSLEATSARNEIDDIHQLEHVPRDLQAPELVVNS